MKKKYLLSVLLLSLSMAVATMGCDSIGDKSSSKDKTTQESDDDEDDDDDDDKDSKKKDKKDKKKDKKDKEKDEDEDEEEDEDEDEDSEDEDEDEDDDKDSEDEDEDDDKKDDKKKDKKDKSDDADVDCVEASLNKPAKTGEWFAINEYSPVDSEYHTCYMRITGIERDQDAVYEAIDEFLDDSSYYDSFTDDLGDDDLEYCYFDYEIYYPEDYPAESWGITSPEASGVSICNTKDSGAISGYIGLSTTESIDLEQDIYPGDTFKGRELFVMVKGYDDFLIKYTDSSADDYDDWTYCYANPNK